MTIYAGSGHRPKLLGLSYSDNDYRFLVDFLKREILKLPDISKGISGMASGFDLAYAEALLELRIPFIAACPFQGQAELWPIKAQNHYYSTLEQAVEIVTLYDKYQGKWQYLERDEWMVDHADKVICLWNGNKKSGTAYTVLHAENTNKQINNLWSTYRVHYAKIFNKEI